MSRGPFIRAPRSTSVRPPFTTGSPPTPIPPGARGPVPPGWVGGTTPPPAVGSTSNGGNGGQPPTGIGGYAEGATGDSGRHQVDAQVTMRRSQIVETSFYYQMQDFHNETERTQFNHYAAFINRVMCEESDRYSDRAAVTDASGLSNPLRDLAIGSNAYQILRTATEIFLVLESGVLPRTSFRSEGAPALNDEPGVDELHRVEPVPDTRTGSVNELTNDEGTVIATDRREGAIDADAASRMPEMGTPSYTSINEALEDNLVQILGEQRRSYIHTVLRNAFGENYGDHVPEAGQGDNPFCDDTILASRAREKLLPIELIWSYWHEEGMLVQTMNAISLRFQNVKGPDDRDPLSELEIDPLRPLGNLIWGYIQDEQNRLTVKRRAYEYQHHYGMGLLGKALPNMRPADVRSKFLMAWHSLLFETWKFFEQDADTTKISDGFPLLNAAKEVHLILAQGAHNQFGDLPWAARVEMLMQQWLLARREMREFLRGRFMIPYTEPWMHAVDAMKRLKRWSDVTVQHFHDLAFFGERLLLSLRYGNWNSFTNQDFARVWARFVRPEVQGYIHAYRAVTGVDLTRSHRDGVDATLPAIHLRNRLQSQINGAR